jgi:cytochrome oxidase Cu insertion factor (SCO1/SenC/PrrC family)
MLVQARTLVIVAAATALHAAAPRTAAAQVAAASAAQAAGPAVGDLAPDFTLRGATRYGLLQTPVRLSDYRGSTVVLAFFYQARTKG